MTHKSVFGELNYTPDQSQLAEQLENMLFRANIRISKNGERTGMTLEEIVIGLNKIGSYHTEEFIKELLRKMRNDGFLQCVIDKWYISSF